MSKSHGFTLVELLMVISVIGLLSGLAIPAINQARSKGDQAAGLSNLRQVGLAVQSFATDNNNTLPCVFSGQNPRYRIWSTNSLGQNLWQYLGASEPNNEWQEAKALGNPAYFRKRKTNTTMSLFLNVNVPSPGDANVFWMPFGDPSFNKPSMRLVALSEAGLSKTWAMVNPDKEFFASPPPPMKPFTGYGWYGDLPDKPLYGNVRTYLYFDWSAKAVPVGSNP